MKQLETQTHNFGIIHINRIAIIQYILIYIVIQYNGGRVAEKLGSDLFYGGTLIVCAFLLWSNPKRLPLKKKIFTPLIVIIMSMGITFCITNGDLSLGTILSILSRFVVVYVAIQYEPENFLNRFLNMTFLMACISLTEFAFVQVVGETRALSFFSLLPEIQNRTGWLGSSYGLFFICYNFMDPARNAYMFGEPGEYQILLIAALYLMTFFENNIDVKKKKIYYIVFIATLITVQSTTGYFNLIAFTISVLIVNRNNLNQIAKRSIIILLVVLIVYLIFFYSDESFLYTNFISKIMNDDNIIDLAVNTGAARVGPMMRFWETLLTVPHKLIFGVGYNGLNSIPFGGYSTCGLLNSIVMIGFISSVILYGRMVNALIYGANSFIQIVLALFIVINMGLSQPDIMPVMSVLICMYGEISRLNNKSLLKESYIIK